jgi:hypothetical protein
LTRGDSQTIAAVRELRCADCRRLIGKPAPDGLATIAFDRCAWLVDLRAYTCKCGAVWKRTDTTPT